MLLFYVVIVAILIVMIINLQTQELGRNAQQLSDHHRYYVRHRGRSKIVLSRDMLSNCKG